MSKPALHERVVPFAAGDGMPLNLIHVRGHSPPTRGPVLLVHGAGVRANLFRPPTATNLVDTLVAEGYDVWLENWRASIDLPPNLWTLDQAALYDHPRAVETVVAETGAESVRAIIHCQGATSFAMSAVAGLLPKVDTIVANAVTLHPVVPRWSWWKLNAAVPAVSLLTQYLDCRWGVSAATLPAKLIAGMVKLTHHECGNPICKMVSFTYGSGFPALWRHENLDDATHDWIRGEFAHVPLRFFKQMARSVNRGRMTAYENLPGLPNDYTDSPPKTKARFALLAGARSRCFLPAGQSRTHEFLSSFRGKFHTIHIFPEYSHLDIFIGRNAARDVFSTILQELERRGEPT